MNATLAETDVLREVRLYGHLAKRFGKVFHLAVASAAEAVHALCAVLPGFREHVLQHNEPGYRVFLGRPGQEYVPVDRLGYPSSAREPICIVPVVAGAKDGGFFQAVLGVVLIAAGVFFQNPALIQLGVGLMIGGVLQSLNAPKKAEPRPGPEGSFAFDSITNVTTQGGPVPLTYGRCWVGSVVVSFGIAAEQIQQAVQAVEPPAPQPLPPEQDPNPNGAR